MENETVEIHSVDDNGTPSNNKLEVNGLGVVILGLAAVGGYVVAKRVISDVRENMKIRREMKKLYKEHRKQSA